MASEQPSIISNDNEGQSSQSASTAVLPHLGDLEKAVECHLCLLMVCEPISAACGHTFCRLCLVRSLRRYQKKCPTCRSVCHVNAEDAPVNIMIKSIAMAINPTLYTSRLQEIEAEKASWNTVLPIFYYNQALFPGCKLSLHLFEPRYKIMMQRIINSTRMFAYVPNYTNYTAVLGDVALIAQLEEAEFLSDGRCMLDAKMTGRYTIIDHYVENGTQGLHYCRLEPLVDNPIADSDLEIVNGYRNIASGILFSMFDSRIRLQIESRYGPAPTDLSTFSLWLTALTPISERSKAEWLRSKDTKGRMHYCVQAMTSMLSQSPSHQVPTSDGEEEEDGDEEEYQSNEQEDGDMDTGNDDTSADDSNVPIRVD